MALNNFIVKNIDNILCFLPKPLTKMFSQ